MNDGLPLYLFLDCWGLNTDMKLDLVVIICRLLLC